jgi:2-polyprenyl-3-methyl-5-hydroxy-6-metoxy-1,4-benzoquinol methylase
MDEEGRAFDRIAQEREKHGFVPDLQGAKNCDWFYNNPWRRPYLADMVFGRYFRFIKAHTSGKTLLEVGSGTGYMSLEMARSGFHVTGIDLSAESVRIAKQTASKSRHGVGFGSLEYLISDFNEWNPLRHYDNICFVGVLHHISNLNTVLSKTRALLKPSGKVLVIEPAREQVTVKDAMVIALIRLLLSVAGTWYEQLAVPSTMKELDNYVRNCMAEYREAHDVAGPTQSPHDNVSSGKDIRAALEECFTNTAYDQGLSFFPRMCGGIRGQDEGSTTSIASLLHLFAQYGVKHQLVNSFGFAWAGVKQ